VVHSSYHRLCAEYYKIVGPATKYYSSALLFFQYTPLESFTEEERVRWAYDLAVAALVAETIFNFGEILEYDIMQSLRNEKLQWLLDLLVAFKLGSIEKFTQVGCILKNIVFIPLIAYVRLATEPEVRLAKSSLFLRIGSFWKERFVFDRWWNWQQRVGFLFAVVVDLFLFFLELAERVITFDDICQHCQVTNDQVVFHCVSLF
jgi:hypothetical protein